MIVALLLCAVILVSNSWHHFHNVQPGWDEAWYLGTSFDLFYALKEGIGLFASHYIHALKFTAPLVTVFPLPLYFLFGPSERLALWVNDIWLLLTWWAVYALARDFWGEKVGWIAVSCVALIPLNYGLSRSYLIEPALTAMVAWTHWALWKHAQEEKSRGILLGVLLGVGILTKTSFLLYVMGSLWIFRKALLRTMFVTLGLALLMAMTWYVPNARYVIPHALSAAWGAASRPQDFGPFWSLGGIFNFLYSVLRDGFSWGYGLAAVLIFSWDKNWRKKGFFSEKASQILLGWFLIPFFVCAFLTFKDIRYLVPAFPAVALLLSRSVFYVIKTPWGKGFFFLIVLLLLKTLSTQTLGWPVGPPFRFNGPPHPNGFWDRQAVLDVLTQREKNKPLLVGMNFDYPDFNFRSLESLTKLHQQPIQFDNLNYISKSPEVFLKKKWPHRYVLIVKGIMPFNLDNSINRHRVFLQEAFEKGLIPSKRVVVLPLTSGIEVDVYELSSS